MTDQKHHPMPVMIERLSNIKFAADCAIKEPESIYAQEFFMLLDETFGTPGDYEAPVQALAVSKLIEMVFYFRAQAESLKGGE